MSTAAGRAEHAAGLPFTDYIVKVHSRCDLACDYCYMYPPGDDSWRALPPVMPPNVVSRLAERIAEHVDAHRPERINLLLHGGEPLLAGTDVLRSVVASVRAAVDCPVSVGIQTNGLRLTSEHLELFAELSVGVSLSLDGVATDHDKRRRSHGGHGSHERVVRAIETVRNADRETPGLFAGLLCVVDLESDPVETLKALFAHEPPTVDLLLPHASWADPPRRGSGAESGSHHPDYGLWLTAAFEYWYGMHPAGPVVRLFHELLVTLLGGPSAIDTVGLSPSGSIVIETDGSIEQIDALKTIYPGAARTGLDLFHDALDAALEHPGIRARQSGLAALSEECRACEVVTACGGGFYAHRYRPGSGFRNPSVYCDDLFHLVSHMRDRIGVELAKATS